MVVTWWIVALWHSESCYNVVLTSTVLLSVKCYVLVECLLDMKVLYVGNFHLNISEHNFVLQLFSCTQI